MTVLPCITFDPEADAVLIRLAAGAYAESEEVHPGVMLDFDVGRRVLAIEIRPASKVLASETWSAGSLPTAASAAPPVDPADYVDQDVDDEANPEWSAEDFAQARPLAENEAPS